MSKPSHFWEGKYFIPNEDEVISFFNFVQRRKGWIYAIHCPEHPEWGFKIGFSKVNPFQRAHQFGISSASHHYEVVHALYVMNCPWAEKKAHQYLNHLSAGKEWFKCTSDEALASLQHAESLEDSNVSRYCDKSLLLSGKQELFMIHGVMMDELIRSLY